MEFIGNSPKFRLVITLLFTVIIGILSSIFATEITPDGVLDLSLVTHVQSFGYLLLSFVISTLLHFKLSKYDQHTLDFADDQHCIAHIRKTKLEALARLVKSDPETANLINVTALLQDLKVKNK